MILFKAIVKVVKKIYYRIYSDYFMPSRLHEYEELLQEAIKEGYKIHSVLSFWDEIEASGLRDDDRYLILRHDVDTDLKTAHAMWVIEQRLGVESSYYFRLSTLNISLMNIIHRSGSEASYHYEEIASFCKRNGLGSKEAIQENMAAIQEDFKKNYLHLREVTGLPMKTVAAHGDFVNRKLGIPNEEILKEGSLRRELGIKLEVYDEAVMKFISKRFSDTHAPSYWKTEHPLHSFKRKENVVYILTHPRHWRRNIVENTLDNVARLWEGILYFTRVRMKAWKNK